MMKHVLLATMTTFCLLGAASLAAADETVKSELGAMKDQLKADVQADKDKLKAEK